MHFDYLILACPLTEDVFKQLGLHRTEGEKYFDKIIVNPYCMTTYWVNNLKIPEPIAPVLPIAKLGKPWAIAQQFNHSKNYFTQFYTRLKPEKNQSANLICMECLTVDSHLFKVRLVLDCSCPIFS